MNSKKLWRKFSKCSDNPSGMLFIFPFFSMAQENLDTFTLNVSVLDGDFPWEQSATVLLGNLFLGPK